MKTYVVEYRFLIRYAPSTGTTVSFVEAETPNQAKRIILANPHVKEVLNVWERGHQLIWAP